MPSVTASHYWDSETVTCITVEIEDQFPDAADEARTQAVRGLLELVDILEQDRADE